MSDTWEDIQAIKNKRNSLRNKLQKRKKERQDIFNTSIPANALGDSCNLLDPLNVDTIKTDEEVECLLLEYLSDMKLVFPITSWHLLSAVTKRSVTLSFLSHTAVCNLLHKFSLQKLISILKITNEGESGLEVTSAEQGKLLDMVEEIKTNSVSFIHDITDENNINSICEKRDNNLPGEQNVTTNDVITTNYATSKRFKEDNDKSVNEVLSLISTPSIREKEVKKIGEEILDLLSKPTAKELCLTEKFRSQGGTQLTEFCIHRTRVDCIAEGNNDCKKLHFRRIIEPHTEENLGDCSYLNTCFHISTCKYVHYQVDKIGLDNDAEQIIDSTQNLLATSVLEHERTILYPPQWIQCDLRFFDTAVLGKFSVVMADPPWDIHMELPYGTLSDDEMRCLGVPNLQDKGLLFLWVTGRAMELGRECLTLWGYEYVDELIWVKTNQLQRIIRTGRTGHWLNHGKEHCLVGMKGTPQNLNRGLDCDVIVAEVRDTSHKPDEIYGIIERLSPGTRKIELFGRCHNVQPNWITLGNQVEGVRLVDPEIISTFKKRYPDGNCMAPPLKR